MPLFELREGSLIPFRQIPVGPELYESEVEDLLWENLEDFTGVALFPVRRQAPVASGGRPDIIALAADGSVFVIEVKRDVDRSQLAQCLEYAGWAKATSLDELASLYYEGPERFFAAWQTFTDTPTPVTLSGLPKLVLAARSIHDRTSEALQYLMGYGLPVQILEVTFHEDVTSRRFVNVVGRSEPEHPPMPPSPATATSVAAARTDPVGRTRQSRSRPTLSELIEAGLLSVGESLEWVQPQVGARHVAVVTDGGELELEDGARFASPSAAASRAAGGSHNGWIQWRAPRRGNRTLDDLHEELLESETQERQSDEASGWGRADG